MQPPLLILCFYCGSKGNTCHKIPIYLLASSFDSITRVSISEQQSVQKWTLVFKAATDDSFCLLNLPLRCLLAFLLETIEKNHQLIFIETADNQVSYAWTSRMPVELFPFLLKMWGDGWLMCQRKGSASLPITASTQSASSESRKIGVSVLEDDIRYDLLASNSDMYYWASSLYFYE